MRATFPYRAYLQEQATTPEDASGSKHAVFGCPPPAIERRGRHRLRRSVEVGAPVRVVKTGGQRRRVAFRNQDAERESRGQRCPSGTLYSRQPRAVSI